MLYCTVLYCSVLFCTVLHCTVVYCSLSVFYRLLYRLSIVCYIICTHTLHMSCTVIIIIAERCEHSQRSDNHSLFKILRYLSIYYICLSACVLHKTVYALCKSYHVGPLCIVPSTLAAVRSTTLRSRSLWGADHFEEPTTLRNCPFDRYGRRRQFSWRQPGRRQRLGPYAYSYRTHRKRSSSQTAAQREERLAAERLRHIPFFISSSYYTCTLHIHHQLTEFMFTLFAYSFFAITHLSNP